MMEMIVSRCRKDCLAVLATSDASTARSYLAGVIKGDGWCTKTLGLRVADFDFAETFSVSIAAAFGVSPPRIAVEKRVDGTYYVVKLGNRSGRFNLLRHIKPLTTPDRSAWLRGMFDSEGSVSLRRNGVSENSWGRSIQFFSTTRSTINEVVRHLLDLGIPSYIGKMKSSVGHKGTKPVLFVTVRGGRDNYQTFSNVVGSSIERKRVRLQSIPSTYSDGSHFSKGGKLSQAWKTHCPHGHSYSGDNLRMYRGKRICRACTKRWNARRSA